MFCCRVCKSGDHLKSYDVKELMFSTKQMFQYDMCGSCKSIQIRDIPSLDQIAKFYPPNYYSFKPNPKTRPIMQRVRALAEAQRDRGLVGASRIGSALAKFSVSDYSLYVIGKAGIRATDRLLDVGCGAGDFLDKLSRAGLRNLAGADPFLTGDGVTAQGVPLHKRVLEEMEGVYDIIVFNHSFEHLADPAQTLRAVADKLRPAGQCLIQMPTPTSEAWEQYGTDWAHWDAPRHLTLMSREGVARLATACGFELDRTFDIGLPWSLMASELHRRGVDFEYAELEKRFTKSEIATFRRTMKAANSAGRGDAVSYALRKSAS